ncbi:unnamed protein product, partial [Urochloa humidicola]
NSRAASLSPPAATADAYPTTQAPAPLPAIPSPPQSSSCKGFASTQVHYFPPESTSLYWMDPLRFEESAAIIRNRRALLPCCHVCSQFRTPSHVLSQTHPLFSRLQKKQDWPYLSGFHYMKCCGPLSSAIELAFFKTKVFSGNSFILDASKLRREAVARIRKREAGIKVPPLF